MQLQHEQSQDWDGSAESMGNTENLEDQNIIQALQRQIDELTADNLLLAEQLAHKDQLNAMVAHELRGPLSPIITYAQIIARPGRREETIQRGTSIIIGQAQRLNRIVHDLLDAARLSTGQFTLQRKPCDIVALAKEVVEQLRPVASHHTLAIDLPDTPVSGNWDSERLQQAFGNLLDNAVKYSDEQTTVTVRIRTTDSHVHVSVHNQGTSIPLEQISQLFQPFVRLPATSERQGSGLGLYITRCIIEEHGGKLGIEPHTEEGQGTTFWFELPL
ncbi:MAG TPA: HAMP domain-containing sensor histidine kinase [Ktedonobacteraceae bacterium]|nr:HAMP domain-containing sensor histidine kinase [Ktedonobacteraceae bacterium]